MAIMAAGGGAGLDVGDSAHPLAQPTREPGRPSSRRPIIERKGLRLVLLAAGEAPPSGATPWWSVLTEKTIPRAHRLRGGGW